jgi:hypothetical protein
VCHASFRKTNEKKAYTSLIIASAHETRKSSALMMFAEERAANMAIRAAFEQPRSVVTVAQAWRELKI